MEDAELVMAVVVCLVMVVGMAASIAYMEKRIDDKYGDYDKKIETKARAEYFASDAKKAIGISIYTDGYKEGFLAALCEVNHCIKDLPNNKERLTAILELIEEYDKD